MTSRDGRSCLARGFENGLKVDSADWKDFSSLTPDDSKNVLAISGEKALLPTVVTVREYDEVAE